MALRAVVCLASIPLACAALESELAAEVRELRALVGGLQSELADVRRENELRRAAEPPAPHRGLQTASSSSTRASITYDGATLRATAPLNVTTLHVDSVVHARAPPSGKFTRVANADETYSAGTLVPFDVVTYDTWGAYDTSTYKYAAPVRGVYLVWMKFFINTREQQARAAMCYEDSGGTEQTCSLFGDYSEHLAAGTTTFLLDAGESAYVRVHGTGTSLTAAFWEHHCEWGITLIAKY